LNDRQAVDEVLQEVAIAALRHGPMRLASGEVSAWLYRVAVRQALLQRRRAARSERRLAEYARRVEVGHTGGGDPLRWLLADEEAALVREALLRLSRADRELLLLKYTDNWSCKDLAAHLGIRLTTVETRLLRARERLRCELSNQDVGPKRNREPDNKGAKHE
jgi:RNA polymerase sigma-70 factor (ECF subfamily)